MPRELKTHCPQGHEFTPENTYVQKTGGRKCRACMNARTRARQAAKRAAAQAGKQQCTRCHHWKPFEDFPSYTVRRQRGMVVKYKHRCKACRSEVECAIARHKRAQARQARETEHRAVCAWLLDRLIRLWQDGATDDWLAGGLGVSKHAMRPWMRGTHLPAPHELDDLTQRVQRLEALWPRVRTSWDDERAKRRRSPKLSRTNPLRDAPRAC